MLSRLRLIETHRSYAVYVLEASTSNRLTYYLPPLVSASPFHACCAWLPHVLEDLRLIADLNLLLKITHSVRQGLASPSRRSSARTKRLFMRSRSIWLCCTSVEQPHPLTLPTNMVVSQNLIPLMLRPLRLVIRADQLRNTRIFLLKALHWPFVACIIGYESSRQFLQDRRNAYTSFKVADASSGSHTPAILRQPLLSKAASQRPDTTGDIHATNGTNGDRSDTILALERLATSLQQQLAAVKDLLDNEKARSQTNVDP